MCIKDAMTMNLVEMVTAICTALTLMLAKLKPFLNIMGVLYFLYSNIHL